jgi:hypothetical protein
MAAWESAMLYQAPGISGSLTEADGERILSK